MLRNLIGNRQPRAGEIKSIGVSRRMRFLAALAAVGLLALLFVAGRLQPDARGYGTHEQLGFSGCTFKLLLGSRCPACGMTTAWSNVMHGRLVAALQASVTGTLLAVLAAIAAVWGLAVAVSGKRDIWTDAAVVASVLSLASLGLGEWAVRLWWD